MTRVDHDPVATMIEFFEARLADADRFAMRSRCILDPGTGFAPPNWPWEERYLYQREVYTNLDELRRFDLPLYIALPWKRTPQHDELLEIVVAPAARVRAGPSPRPSPRRRATLGVG